MQVNMTSDGWVKVYDDKMNQISSHAFPNAENAMAGTDFIVVQLKGGWVEVYDTSFKLISSDVYLNVDQVTADDCIIVNYRSGWSELYDKQFNFQSIRFCG